MSTLFVDTDVEFVTIVLNKKDGSGATTYNFGTEFYPASGVYSGSSIVYPLLAGAPTCIRSCGINSAVRHNVTLRIFAHAPLSNVNTTFCDLLTTHDYQNGTATVYYYPKPDDTTTTNGASNVRQTLEIVDIAFGNEENILEIQARDTWFKDKPFGTNYVGADFLDNVSGYEDKWKGEFAPVVFGDSEDGTTGIIVSACPIFDSNSPSPNQAFYLAFGKLTDAMNTAGQTYAALRGFYVRNPFKDLDPRDFFPLSMQSDVIPFADQLAGPDTLVSGTDFNMNQWRFATKITLGSTGRMISEVTARLKKSGTITAGMGQLMVTIQRAVNITGSQWAAVGPPLYQAANIDPTALTGSDVNYAFLFGDIPRLPPGHSYFFIEEWTNATDATNRPICKYNGADTSDPLYTNDQTVNKNGWTQTSARHQLQVWDYGTTSVILGTTSGNYAIMNTLITSTGGGTQVNAFGDIDFKVGLSGLTDNSNGDYTGTPNALLENPADIIHFLLREPSFGAGLSSTYADYTAIAAVRSTIGTGLKAAWAQESPASVAEIINEVCRQFRLRLWKTRAGKMSLNFPTPESGAYDFDLSEASHRGDLRVLGITESPDTDLINSIDVLYSPDAIGVHSDAALDRKVVDQKYLELEYIRDGATGEASNDTQRAAAATASIALYGLRAAVWRFYMHVRQDGVRKVLNYYFDRYSKQRTLLTVRIPRKTWYSTIDLFSKGRTKHSRIMGVVGSRGDEPVRVTDGAGSTALIYENGVPVTSILEGTHTGECLKIEESGAYMVITVESMNSFEGYV